MCLHDNFALSVEFMDPLLRSLASSPNEDPNFNAEEKPDMV